MRALWIAGLCMAACSGDRPSVLAPARATGSGRLASASSSVVAADVPAPTPTALVLSVAAADTAAKNRPRYDVDQAIDDVGATFAGKIAIGYPNPTGAALDSLPLLLHPNASAELGSPAASGSLSVTDVKRVQDGKLMPAAHDAKRPTLVMVRLDPPVAAGEVVRIEVRYQGKLRVLPPNANDVFAQGMSGLASMSGSIGAADYGLLAIGDGLFTVASAYPMVAPYRDGSFDVSPPSKTGDLAYNEVATFRARTVVPDGVSIVTNLVDAKPTKLADGGQVVVSEGDLVRDLVVVGGRDLESTERKVGTTIVRSSYRAKDAAAGKAALEVAASSLASFTKRFGPYPYGELDVAEASLVGGAGGVEFSAMVLVAGMLYRPVEDSQHPLATLMKMWGRLGAGIGAGLDGAPSSSKSAPSKQGPPQVLDALGDAFEFTVAHEVAHQWFAGIVGNDSHRFPSLDEPAAQYLATLAMEDRHGKKRADHMTATNVKLNYGLYRMLGGADRPVLRSTQEFRSPIEYAALVYGKAPYVYHGLRKRLGDERLHAAMRAAIARHQFQLVSTEKWIASLDELAGDGSGVRAAFDRGLTLTHGDADLGIGDPAEFVLDTAFPPEVGGAMKSASATMGMKPGELLRMLFGGALGDDAPVGPGLSPLDALDKLQRLGR